MACLLDKDDVLAIYGDIYETLLGRINGDVKTKFNPAEYIKNLHAEIAEINDPKFALEVAQAAPEIMLQVIATRKNVRQYFVENKISQDPISEMSISFENVDMVQKFISGQTKSLTDHQDKIKRKRQSKKDVEIIDPNDATINYSNVQKKGKVEDPLTNTLNFAVTENPEFVADEDQPRHRQQRFGEPTFSVRCVFEVTAAFQTGLGLLQQLQQLLLLMELSLQFLHKLEFSIQCRLQ